MTAILGISAFYHDSAAAIIIDGKIIAAAQEERFTRIKHDHRFPEKAIEYCLKETNIDEQGLDYVGFYEKPLLTFDRLLETYLSFVPAGFRSFSKAMPLWLKQKLRIQHIIRVGLKSKYRKQIVFGEHHESHAASAFFPSPFEEAAILTMDGVGEWATASIGTGSGNKILLSHEQRFPHSLGLLYSAFTYYCGFKVNSGEYKLMGLAPYGEPKYVNKILDHLIDLKKDGSFRMNMDYFNYCQGLTMTSEKFHELFGGPPRKSESEFTQRDMDIAASIQQVTENITLRSVNFVQILTGMKNLCMAGGVALNCVANGKILRDSRFDEIWTQPAAGDAGGALGIALFIWHQLLGQPRKAIPSDSQKGSLLGPQFNGEEIKESLDPLGARYQFLENDSQLCDLIANYLDEGKIVGWMQGRMEFGPRALGNRSILGDARNPEMQSVMNLKIKLRESFRPFAPSILQNRVQDYFETRPNESSPYMLLVAPVNKDKRIEPEDKASQTHGPNLLKLGRSEIPSVTHVDYSARIQTVDASRHGKYHQLLLAFESKTHCPVIINTSFNIRGEPIVCTPEDAYRCFMATNMDILVIGNYVLLKENQPNAAKHQTQAYLSRFQLD